MVDSGPPESKEKNSALLMVTGAGDTRETRVLNNALAPFNASDPNGLVPIAAIPTLWSGPLPLRRLPFRHSWQERWAEFMSACWITFVLLVISFLIFYIAGVVMYKQQTFVVFKCNVTADGTMYYHKIVDDHVHFSYYGEFLSTQAMKYPNYRHHIYFLFDDTKHDRLRRILFNKAILNKRNVISTREIKSFQRRYRNTNITVMPLKEFFATSPLKEYWKLIPPKYLVFYARIYSIWENGGTGIDLDTYNMNYVSKLEHYIQDYHKKVEETQQNEKAKSDSIKYYMGSGTIFLSYTLVRINENDYISNITNNVTAHQVETNSSGVVRKNENNTNRINFTSRPANITLREVLNVVEDSNVTSNMINKMRIEILSHSDVIGKDINKTTNNKTLELRKELNVTANKTSHPNNIETLSNSIVIKKDSNKTTDNNTWEFHKEFDVTAYKTSDLNNIEKLSNSDIIKKDSNKATDNNTRELHKEFNVTANKTSENNIETLLNMIMKGDTYGNFENMISQPDIFSQQIEISVSGQGYEDPYFGIESGRVAPQVLAIEPCGTFIATVTLHHKLLERLMCCKRPWQPPKCLIQDITYDKCSPEVYDVEICPYIFNY